MREIKLKEIKLINGERLSYRHATGGTKTIILVHGNLASSLFYEELMLSLPEEFTCYAIDMRGFGNSSYNRPLDTLRDLAGDLKLFVDALNLKDFDLLGWSTGGAVSMLFCSNYGYLIKRLFLVASAPASGYHSYRIGADGEKVMINSKQQLLNDPARNDLLKALTRNDKTYYRSVWEQAIYNINKPKSEIFSKQLEDSLKQQNLMDIYYGLSQFNITNYYNGVSMGTEEINNINVPVRIIHGKQDLLIPVEDIIALKNMLGDYAKLIVIEECGHSPMVDALDTLCNTIIND